MQIRLGTVRNKSDPFQQAHDADTFRCAQTRIGFRWVLLGLGSDFAGRRSGLGSDFAGRRSENLQIFHCPTVSNLVRIGMRIYTFGNIRARCLASAAIGLGSNTGRPRSDSDRIRRPLLGLGSDSGLSSETEFLVPVCATHKD